MALEEDRIRRRFLWHGADSARNGHCLVHWKWVTRPKRIGGLDVLDLERFNKALRLCWPWLLWTDNNKPWHHLPPSSSPAETALFRTCIEIHLGDGQKIRFWHDRWIVGQAPRDITSALYKLAWPKNNTVAEAICNGKWMRGLRRISTTPESKSIRSPLDACTPGSVDESAKQRLLVLHDQRQVLGKVRLQCSVHRVLLRSWLEECLACFNGKWVQIFLLVGATK
jgi:hypothetical protein